MKSSAKVYRRTGSPYFMAWFLIWNARRQKWTPKTQTTKATDEAKALEIARGYERVAQAAGGPSGNTRLSREFVLGVLNSILTISGHEEVLDTRTFGELSEEYIKRLDRKSSTFNTFRAGLRLFTKHVPGAATTPINAFTKKTLQDWYDRMIESGRKASTVNSSLQLVSRLFEAAREEGYCPRNPAKLVTKAAKQTAKRHVFQPDEITRVIGYFQQADRWEWLTVFLLGLCTSQRLGDCARAQWAQFSEKEGMLVWSCTPQKTKSYNKTLEIPIVEPLLSHMRTLLAEPRTSLFVCPTLAATRMQGVTGLSSQFIRHLVEAGIEQQVIAKGGKKGNRFRTKTFHSLRHTCNSWMANAGVPTDIRQRITGHTTAHMNQVYTHLTLATSAEALGKGLAKAQPKTSAPPALAASA